MIFLLGTVFIGIALFEILGLIRKKYWRELIVFLLLLSSAFILSLLQPFDIKIPNPIKGVEYYKKNVPFCLSTVGTVWQRFS
jgi:hypothetical protein